MSLGSLAYASIRWCAHLFFFLKQDCFTSVMFCSTDFFHKLGAERTATGFSILLKSIVELKLHFVQVHDVKVPFLHTCVLLALPCLASFIRIIAVNPKDNVCLRVHNSTYSLLQTSCLQQILMWLLFISLRAMAVANAIQPEKGTVRVNISRAKFQQRRWHL